MSLLTLLSSKVSPPPDATAVPEAITAVEAKVSVAGQRAAPSGVVEGKSKAFSRRALDP